MKTLLKVVGGVVLLVIALIACVVTWLAVRKPASKPASASRFTRWPSLGARSRQQ